MTSGAAGTTASGGPEAAGPEAGITEAAATEALVAEGGREERTVPEQMAFKARALAQTHPLTHVAKTFIDRAVANQEKPESGPDVTLWASVAMLHGYCLRRVEEDHAGLELQAVRDAHVDVDLDDLAERTTRISAELRTEAGDVHALGDGTTVVGALDKIIASEVEKRLDQTNTASDRRARAELEEYMIWWVLHGYALRVAEAAVGAVA